VVIVERKPRTWPLWLLALPAFVAVWSGWVGMGKLCGFGAVQPLPGIWDSLTLDTSITLPIGMEAYAAYAIKVWLSGEGSPAAVAFARRSTIAALTVGALGQVIYHLLTAAGVDHAPWPITAAAATLPVGVLGMGATLAHLVQQPHAPEGTDVSPVGLPVTHAAVSDVARPPQKPAPRRTTTPATSRAASSGVTRSAQAAATTTRAVGAAGASDTAARVAALLTEDRYLTSAAIADRLGCSDRTARRHRTAVLKQLDHADLVDQAEHADQAAVVIEDATTTAAVAPIRTTEPNRTEPERTEPEHTEPEHTESEHSESEGDAA